MVSNFGVVFAGSLPAALAEMARVARPGGRLAFTTWGRTPAFAVIEDAWRAAYPASAPPAPAPPADGAAVTAQLAIGGKVIKHPSLLNVLRNTHDRSCY